MDFEVCKLMVSREALSRDHDVSKSEFLSALAEREEHNRTGKMNVIVHSGYATTTHHPLQSIVFIRALNSKNQEISGYIDYASRLKVYRQTSFECSCIVSG